MQLVLDRIGHLKAALAELKEALASEDSNSAGDKHETGRSMIDLEQEQLSGQLKQSLDLKDSLERLAPRQKTEAVVAGSLVETSMGIFYIAVGLGKVTVDGQLCYVISTDSPIGQALLGHVPGETIGFNERQISILSLH